MYNVLNEMKKHCVKEKSSCKKNEDLLTIELWECNIDLNSDYVQCLFPFAENPRLQKSDQNSFFF